MGAKGFPGKREEPIRAGIPAIIRMLSNLLFAMRPKNQELDELSYVSNALQKLRRWEIL